MAVKRQRSSFPTMTFSDATAQKGISAPIEYNLNPRDRVQWNH
jgi:hypothetical protein